MNERVIETQATVARIACAQMTRSHLAMLQDSVERARSLVGRSQWDSKAAAHEMERHPRGLFYMWRLALPGRPAWRHSP